LNLEKKLSQLNLPSNFLENVTLYKEHLMKWNKIHNLTGARDEETLNSFIYDAVYPISFLPKVNSLVDIGTGAGFPGLILAMGLPDVSVTLVEPLSKRASFLQFVKASLGLENVTVIKKRAQEVTPQVFELVTSRAVTDTKMLLDITKHLRDERSLLLFYKGEKVFEEVEGYTNYEVIQKENRHYLLLKGEEV